MLSKANDTSFLKSTLEVSVAIAKGFQTLNVACQGSRFCSCWSYFYAD